MNKASPFIQTLKILGILSIPCIILICGLRKNFWDELNVPFEFDVSQPFKLDFGRGSARYGFDTISIDENGYTVIYRGRAGPAVNEFWQCAAMTLPAENMRAVARAVAEHDLSHLNRSYLSQIRDGTQWALWIRQGNRSKAVYFDNQFPEKIRGFARSLDEILFSAGSETLDWVRTTQNPYSEPLWKALE